jgi:hypothetical protein
MPSVMIKGMFAAIEKWASESEERVQLLVILICVALAVFVLIVIGVTAMVFLPRGSLPF